MPVTLAAIVACSNGRMVPATGWVCGATVRATVVTRTCTEGRELAGAVPAGRLQPLVNASATVSSG